MSYCRLSAMAGQKELNIEATPKSKLAPKSL